MAYNSGLDRTLALAGVVQCAELAQGLARTGKIDQYFLSVSVRALFAFDAQTVLDVYGEISELQIGLRSLRDYFFKPKSPVQAEIMRYAFQLIQLANKVKTSAKINQQLALQLEAIVSEDLIDMNALDDDMLNSIANVYVRSISTLKPRVIVNGEQGYLAQTQTASKVRVCLLCGLRSAYLWLQKGGGRLQLLTSRKLYQKQASALLSEMV